MAYRCIPSILVVLAVAGCAAPLASDLEPGVTVTAQIALKGGDARRLMQVVEPWTAADVAKAVVILYKDNADPTPDAEVNRLEVSNAQLGGTLSFSNLRRNTAYLIKTQAYTVDDERIDNADYASSSCTTTFTVGTESPVAIGSIALQLRNKGFNGASSGNAIDITPGGVDEPTGTETIDLVTPTPTPTPAP